MINDRILVIDDESGIRSSLKGILEDEGYEVKTTDTGEKGLDMVKGERFDLVFLDIWLPEMNGIEALEKIKSTEENTQVVMITGHGSVEAAVKATKLGAYNFLEKPLTLEKVTLTAKNALRQKRLEEENIQLRERLRAKYHLVGKSPAIQKLSQEIQKAAPSNGRILIVGENGTGKELIAQLIHQQSQRKDKRFVQINAAAIPDDLIESELFGYTKGAFPGTDKDKRGKLLLADGGTLYLEEIGELSIRMQAKVVKFIEEGYFEPLGATEPVGADVRIIAATDKDLRKLITKKLFREDLYFSLNVVPMSIPPLRERKEDIPLLINYFLKLFSEESGKKQKTMSNEAMQAFMNYAWPGNISELVNVIERFIIMIKEDEIQASHLYLLVEPRESQFIQGLDESFSLKEAREHFDREYIHNALLKNKWDLTKAARDLKVEKNSLAANIKRLGIQFLEWD